MLISLFCRLLHRDKGKLSLLKFNFQQVKRHRLLTFTLVLTRRQAKPIHRTLLSLVREMPIQRLKATIKIRPWLPAQPLLVWLVWLCLIWLLFRSDPTWLDLRIHGLIAFPQQVWPLWCHCQPSPWSTLSVWRGLPLVFQIPSQSWEREIGRSEEHTSELQSPG